MAFQLPNYLGITKGYLSFPRQISATSAVKAPYKRINKNLFIEIYKNIYTYTLAVTIITAFFTCDNFIVMWQISLIFTRKYWL